LRSLFLSIRAPVRGLDVADPRKRRSQCLDDPVAREEETSLTQEKNTRKHQLTQKKEED